MLRIKRILALLLVTSLFLCTGKPAGPEENRPVYKGLYGKLVDNDGDPVSGAVVTVIDITESLNKAAHRASDADSASTDDSGYYSFESLDAGTYNLQGDYENGKLVVIITGIEYDGSGQTLEVETDTLRAPGKISGRVNTGTEDDGGVVCYIPGTSFLAMTDDSGGFTLSNIPEGEYTITYRKEGLTTVSDDGVAVRSGEETDVPARDMEADPRDPPPAPGGLTVTFDTLYGCAVLTWNPVMVADLAGYHIYRNDTASTDPERITGQLVKDTIYFDTVFTDLNDTIDRVLAYRIKAQDENANLSTVYSKAVTVDAPPLKTVRTFIRLNMRNTIGDDTASINDTVTVIAAYRNETRKNVRLRWYDGDNDSLLRDIHVDDYSGTDTLLISWNEPSVKEIYVLVTDEAASIWRETGRVVIFNFAPVITAIRSDTTISINDSIHFFASAEDRDGMVEEYAWDFDGDGTYDVTDDNDVTGYRYSSTGTFEVVLKVTDDDGEETQDTLTVTVVQDIPTAEAGNNITVVPGDTAYLHGTATQDFGEIVKWEWKIGDGVWKESNGPDTWFIISEKKKTVICSLRVTDDDNNFAVDTVEVYSIAPIKRVAGGAWYTLILEADGALWACGANSYGQLGDGTTISRSTPVFIMNDVKDMNADYNISRIIKTDNTLWACGRNDHGQLKDGTMINRSTPVFIMSDVQSFSGISYLKTDSTLWKWGMKDSIPELIMSNVKKISEWMILKTDNTLWAMGPNNYGELGDGTTTDRLTPVHIMDDVLDVACGPMHSLIVKNDNTLWACGYNNTGQLGDGTTSSRSTPVHIMDNVQSVSGGEDHSLFLTTSNEVYGCGDYSSFMFTDDDIGNPRFPMKIMEDVRYISAGGFHSMMIKTNGTLWGCGGNYSGELADGTTTTPQTPVQAILPKE